MKLKKKWLQKKALDGVSKVAALSDAASSSVIAVPGEGVVAAAPIEDTKPTGDADLVGQLARVIDDTLGFGVAGEMVEILSVVGDQILARVQKAGGSKLGRNVCLKTSQFALRSKLPVPKPSKKDALQPGRQSGARHEVRCRGVGEVNSSHERFTFSFNASEHALVGHSERFGD